MKKKLLGQTGITVSEIGLGTVKFGRNQGVKYPHSFSLPSDSEISDLLILTRSLGINLLDTAPAYGTSEERLGKLLEDRKEWVICTKVGEQFKEGESFFDFSKSAIEKSIHQSLKHLKTDYLDIVLIHSNGEDEKLIAEGCLEHLALLKKAGKIRAFGMSTKSVAGGILAVDQSDVVMVTYNPIETTELQVIQHAHAENKGVFIKKALASGHLQKLPGSDPVQSALQFILKEPGVSSVIVGTLNKLHLENVARVEREARNPGNI